MSKPSIGSEHHPSGRAQEGAAQTTLTLVEQSHLPVRRALEKLGIARATFYRWYDVYQTWWT